MKRLSITTLLLSCGMYMLMRILFIDSYRRVVRKQLPADNLNTSDSSNLLEKWNYAKAEEKSLSLAS